MKKYFSADKADYKAEFREEDRSKDLLETKHFFLS